MFFLLDKNIFNLNNINRNIILINSFGRVAGGFVHNLLTDEILTSKYNVNQINDYSVLSNKMDTYIAEQRNTQRILKNLGFAYNYKGKVKIHKADGSINEMI
jgi:hypothetical protein